MNQTQAEYYIKENERLTLGLEQAMRTIHALNHKLILANNRIAELNTIILNNSATAVGERGHACVAIDGGNL
jgi:hypothetical protein